MSGEKRQKVTLKQAEYNRVMDTTTRRDNYEANVRSRLAGQLRGIEGQLDERMTTLQRRYDHYEQAISGLGEEIREIERAQNRRLKEQAQLFRRELGGLQEQIGEQQQEYLHLIRRQNEQFNSALQTQREELQRQIGELNERIDRKETSEKELARVWLQAAGELLDHIREHYRHEKFTPGALERLQREAELVRDNYRREVYPAAIASGQQTYLNGSDLRVELEKQERKWEAYLEAARQAAANLLASCEAQQECRFNLETEEGPAEVPGEVDFWTGGALKELTGAAAAEAARLQEPENLSLNDLERSISTSGERFRHCAELAEKARQAVVASQMRQNIGQIIAESLRSAGWEVADSTYEGEDYRGSLHLKLGNLQGDEIVTIITPEETAEKAIQNNLNVSFFDRSTNDEALRRERIKAIMEKLKEAGLESGEAICASGTEESPATDIAKLDFDRVRAQPGAAPTAGKKGTA